MCGVNTIRNGCISTYIDVDLSLSGCHSRDCCSSRSSCSSCLHENFKNSHPESGYSRDTDDKHPTDVIVGLALWTRTKGMCCWLLFDDADDCSSEASCTTTDAEDAAGPPLWHSEKVMSAAGRMNLFMSMSMLMNLFM